MNYHIMTYGCQMNVHESEKIAGQLAQLGYTETTEIEKADIVVFNTCTIRENAVHKAYGNIGALKSMKMQNKNLIIAVGGCMTQDKVQAEDLKKRLPFIDIIFGTHNVHRLGEMVQERLEGNKRIFDVWDSEGHIEEDTGLLRTSYPNAWVNIMYGCNNFCTYCIVPYVRGRERSRAKEDIINEVTKLLEEGYKEITLLGQNVNSYGNDLNIEGVNFVNLMTELAELPYKYRLSFMTSHPKDFSEELAIVIGKYDNISKFIHLPIQSGGNNVLKAMNRRYTREQYLEKVAFIDKHVKEYALSSDIMVGFPGETEEDFLDTIDLVKRVRFASAFTFVYSRRHGTKADEMPNQIDEETKTDRIKRLIEVQNAISKEISDSFIGKVVEVLIDEDHPTKSAGRTNCGKLVSFERNGEEYLGKHVEILVESSTISGLKGQLVRVKE